LFLGVVVVVLGVAWLLVMPADAGPVEPTTRVPAPAPSPAADAPPAAEPQRGARRTIFLEALSGERPVAGARAAIVNALGARVEGVTDVDGLVALEVVGAVTRVELRAAGYEPLDASPGLPDDGDASWTAQLRRLEEAPGRVSVRGVVLCDDKPLAGAAVALSADPESGRAVAVETTDARGRFVLQTEVPLRELAEVAVHSTPCGDATAAPRSDQELIFRLSEGGRVRVRVVGADGAPPPKFHVQLSASRLPPLLQRKRGRKLNPALAGARRELQATQAEQSGEGVVVLGPVTEGSYHVIATAPDLRPAHAEVEVQRGDDVNVTLQLGDVVIVRGQVTDHDTGKPIAGARVRARVRLSRKGGYGVARTDADGRYELRTEPGRRHSLTVTKHRYIPSDVSGVQGSGGDVVEKDVALKRVRKGQSKGTRIYSGVGAMLRMTDGAVEILKTFPGGPAFEELQNGDRILEVDGERVRGLPLRDVVERILGEVGEPVELRIERSGEARYVELERARIEAVP
jgi:hypothetical protein